MSMFDDPFRSDRRLTAGCVCGRHASQMEHDHAAQVDALQLQQQQVVAPASEDDRYTGVVASAVMRAMFPQDAARRAFLKSVGASTALAALSQFFPLGPAAEVFAQGAGAIEKKSIKVGFIPITCATPIIMAHPMGFYAKHGLDVEVVKTAGWAVIRDKTLNKEYDAAHMLSPMPLAITIGAGAAPIPYTAPAIENINGQAITLSMKHKDKRDPKAWKGFKFAVPFDYSMHNYLLRYYLAEHGLDPDTDVQIRAVPPPEMVANLRADNIDGFLAPDPVNQRAVYDGVGFIHTLSKELWDGHPCCVFAASKEFVTSAPNTYAALLKSIIDATAFATKAENRKQIAEAIAPANYLNQPVTVVEQVLTGTYADGLGNVKKVPDRIAFDPFPWESFAVWILTQMKRWGQIKGEVDYKSVANQVFLATDTAKLMKEVGLTPPTTTTKTFAVMGKTFDPAKPDEYVASFKIKRA
ncbi:nitrate ABC transporter substrate-binding protein [Rhodoplanes elegans]|uniref:Nitrate ABC transporter substrate-binding protein n=1 Tax=Rhodoplanes elegans TaxID=29408 RepID=A0A327KKC8_9BRAD|nr:CmpA/NrtA family ABC transporter substrate-binding protein [Rhodoplanes elegans]MBK5959499.1 nitrate ABC transporter substrate-binding protein [Rhodoplanes elegans]RAI38957.1 nitrate ABC transporter substrate-binding protein [Rhodoplanes elegans]